LDKKIAGPVKNEPAKSNIDFETKLKEKAVALTTALLR